MLTRHQETLGPDAAPIRLLSPAGAPGSQFAGFGWVGQGVALPDARTVWTPSAPALTPTSPVTLTWDNGQGQIFRIRYSVDENYLFTVDQAVANRGAGAIAVQSYGVVSRSNVSADADSWTIHTGPIGKFDDGVEFEVDYGTIEAAGNTGIEYSTRGGWLGFTDKYWLTAVVPDQASSVSAVFRQGQGGGFQADYRQAPVIVQPGRQNRATARFFAGAKEVAVLDRYEAAGIPLLSRSIDWGWFRVLEEPIFKLLSFLFRIFGNFGVAIIGLTFLIRLLLFPIAQKQFSSMAGMRAIQPKMKALQERYKDDKPQLQKEMIALYQQEKVNPLAGCLPILIQIPIFYALYKVLLVAVEMRHEPFALWVKDLTAPDPLTPINLFGLLDFTPPSFIALGVLPILLGISMWAQFKLNPPPPDPVQAQVFAIMPWVFMVIMAPFAAGLQLYWLTNNILTIAQQKWLYSRHPALRQVEAQAK